MKQLEHLSLLVGQQTPCYHNMIKYQWWYSKYSNPLRDLSKVLKGIDEYSGTKLLFLFFYSFFFDNLYLFYFVLMFLR